MKKEKNIMPFTVAVGLFLMMAIIPSSYRVVSLLLPVYSDMGFSMGTIGVITVLGSLMSILTNLLSAKLFRRIGIKKAMILGTLCMSLFFVVLGLATTELMFLPAMIFMGIGNVLPSYLTASICISNWFESYKSTIISIVFTGMSVGGAVYSIVTGYLLENYSIQYTCNMIAVFILIAGLIVVVGLVKETPEKYGVAVFVSAKEKVKDIANHKNLIFDGKKSKLYILIIIITMFAVGGISSFQVYLPAFWQEGGITTLNSATLNSFFIAFSIPSSIIAGMIADKYSTSVFVFYTSAIGAVSILLMIFLPTTLGFMYATAFLLAISYPIGSLTPTLLLGECTDSATYQELIGPVQAFSFVLMSMLYPLIGALYDITGSYVTGFLIVAVVNIIVVVLILIYVKMRRTAIKNCGEIYKNSVENNFKYVK